MTDLTDDEIIDIFDEHNGTGWHAIARAIIKSQREKDAKEKQEDWASREYDGVYRSEK